jgi:hypothetical protein
MSCSCNIAGLLQNYYEGIYAASLNGNTEVTITSDGLVLIGTTMNQLSISSWAFRSGDDRFLGATCPASASAEVRWITKYDCFNDETHFIPISGGKASITGGPIDGVYLDCDPDIVCKSFSASAQSGPMTPYLLGERRDGFNLVYTGHPIPIQSASPDPYIIRLGDLNLVAYLQSFSLTVEPPKAAEVSYTFQVPGKVL